MVFGGATLTADGMFAGAEEVAGDEADGAGVAKVTEGVSGDEIDGAGVAKVGTSSMTATKSYSSKVSPPDSRVLPARITFPSDPATRESQ